MGSAAARAEIDAPIEAVWRVMLDVAEYGAWNPFIVRAEAAPGALVVGSALRLHVRWREGGGATSPEVVSALEAPARGADGIVRARLAYRFEGWLAKAGGVRGVREQRLWQREGGPTVYETDEQFTGWLSRFVPLAKVQDGFERHAAALRVRAEVR